MTEHRMTAGELRAALADIEDDAWIRLYDPRLDRRLWLDRVDAGNAELVAVLR